MSKAAWCVVVACAVVTVGCGGDEAPAIPDLLHPRDSGMGLSDSMVPETDAATDANNATSDAGVDSGRDAGQDAGPIVPPGCETPPATINEDGVLSPQPHIFYSISPFGFELMSVNFKITEDGDSRGPLIQIYAEVRNNTLNTECLFLPDVSLSFSPLIGVFEGPAYLSMSSRVTSECLGPGDVGVLKAVERGISEQDLAMADSLFVDMMPNTFSTYERAVTPVLSDAISHDNTGWFVTGQVTYPFTLYNYGIRVYPKDDRGVIIDDLLAFPGDLETIFAGSVLSFATDSTACPFDGFRVFQSWIDGPNN